MVPAKCACTNDCGFHCFLVAVLHTINQENPRESKWISPCETVYCHS
jgi:hypothetical protein